MIVKKVPTSKAAAPKSKALNVRALVDYIAGPRAGDAGEKVEHRGAVNLLNIDHEGQVREMVDLAETAKRSPQPVQHWIMSWRPGEQPTPAQVDQAVDIFLRDMGLSDHQAIYALHRNTDNWHVHVAVNRVHPETEKVITVNKGFDHEVAHRAIARIERLQGWERERRALYEPTSDGRLERVRPRSGDDRQPSAGAREFEERTGELSAERVAIEGAAPIIRRARSWGELHAALADQGMAFERRGSGALVWIGRQPVKASTAGRDCSMAALQKRLGEFEPAKDAPSCSTGPTPPGEPRAPLHETYTKARREHEERREARRIRTTERQKEESRGLREKHRREREVVSRVSWRGRGALLNATRSVLAARQAQEKEDLRDRHRLERAGLRREIGRFQGYDEWLTAQNRTLGDAWRHRERRPASIEGPSFEQPTPRDIRAFRAVIDGWRVHYHLTGANGGPAFTDRGRTIDILDSQRRESVLAALQLSAQKWGTFTVHGDERFKRVCVELAAEHGFRITNPELRQAIDAERSRSKSDVRSAAPAHPSPRPASTHAEAYRRHQADIEQSPPIRNVHPSRADAEIAVRLRLTGHSREAVISAIRDGASIARPGERSNWDAYASRTADFAFGAAGSRLAEEFSPQRHRLIKLEGRHLERDIPPRGPSSRFE